MKHLTLSLSLFLTVTVVTVKAQQGPVEKQITDSICACMSRLDISKITTKQEAETAFGNCFAKQSSLLIPLAAEKKVEITDQPAMREIGIQIGKNLLNQNCEAFLKLSMVMVKDQGSDAVGLNSGTTEGVLKRIETKDFNYFVITGPDNKERKFLWLHQFPDSEKFANPASYIGKKISIQWQELEAYIPAAKGYFQLKEVTSISLK